MMFRAAILCLLAIILSGCASTKFQVLEINSLASKSAGKGQFSGLESLAKRERVVKPFDDLDGTIKVKSATSGEAIIDSVSNPLRSVERVNIMFLHGIGWVENRENAPLANNFIQGLAKAYNLETDEKAVSSLCGRDQTDENVQLENHIYIKQKNPKIYQTLPGSSLSLDRLACMDRQVLKVKDDLEYVIYRVFWDEIFWDSLQVAFVGQDDGLDAESLPASLRRSVNRTLKDKLVNFGFSDAVMYLGPAGAEIRNATRGAMCSAALDAAGYSLKDQGPAVDFETICSTASRTSIDVDPFAFVTESLGSKVAYDIMRDAMTDGKDTVHDSIIRGTQVFMLANQIPLLSLSDLGEGEPFRRSDYSDNQRPTIVAFSEINDFLTYELVPFYEQLYRKSQQSQRNTINIGDADDREYIVDLLGFNIIDMRVEFAPAMIPLVNQFVDPLFAHNGHVRQPEVMEYILCGADGKKPKFDGCRVTPERSKRPQK
ncbi:hypothetical protein ACJ3XI_06530 [Litorimonas sp. RW-G-Af-16]|uniref:hypothetical protein n=1 Tax=Litorimonas sp. RW-G-Af-16 TaxID=3241168 RepID=UPI00390C56E7